MSATSGLDAQGISVGYGARPVVHGVDIRVDAGEVVALLGANGVGKTTALLAITGELPLMGGEVRVHGQRTRGPLHKRVRAGLSYMPEGRSAIGGLTVAENLRAARVEVAAVLELFPELEKRLHVRAGLLSGGEQQMLCLGRALACHPNVLIVDELSLGLAPLVVTRLLQTLRVAADGGAAVLFVEQHVTKALNACDRAYVMRRGKIAMEGTAEVMRGQAAEIQDHYLSHTRHPPSVPTSVGTGRPASGDQGRETA